MQRLNYQTNNSYSSIISRPTPTAVLTPHPHQVYPNRGMVFGTKNAELLYAAPKSRENNCQTIPKKLDRATGGNG